MPSSPRSSDGASIRHSRGVSTPPVRSVHPMEPSGSLGWSGAAAMAMTTPNRSIARWRDVEAEHHPALVMLGDVAVSHPAPGIRDVEQDVDDLAGAHQHGVLPDEVRLDDVVAREDHEPARPMDVERVRHRMI